MAAIVLTSACMFFTGCDKVEVEINMEEVLAANKTSELLKHYDNFMVKMQDSRRSLGYYADGELIYEWSDAYTTSQGAYKAYYEILTDDYYSGFSGSKHYSFVHAGGERDLSWTEDLVLNPELFVKETVVSSQEKDGMIIFKTRLTEESMIELGFNDWVDGLYKGSYYETVYTMEKDTKIVKSIKETFVNKASGTKSLIEYVTIANTELPENAAKIRDHVDGAEETCTATVVFDPGTENERTESFSVPKGDTVYFTWEGDYDRVYSNPEMTAALDISFVSLVADGDIAIYLVKDAEKTE